MLVKALNMLMKICLSNFQSYNSRFLVMVFINLSKRTQDLALKEYKKRRKDLTKNI